VKSIAADFPELAKLHTIGKSFEGRDIYVISITSNPNSLVEVDKAQSLDEIINS
jgi:hypothetical protein